MDEALFLTVAKIWAATAWADGVVADNERKLLESVIRNAAVSEATKASALALLGAPMALGDVQIESLSGDQRAGVYRTACRLTTVNRELSDEEKVFLTRLAAHLGLDAATAATIQAEYLRP